MIDTHVIALRYPRMRSIPFADCESLHRARHSKGSRGCSKVSDDRTIGPGCLSSLTMNSPLFSNSLPTRARLNTP